MDNLLLAVTFNAIPAAVLATTLAGYCLAIARLFNAAKLAWDWLPNKIQPLLPVLLVVLPDLAARLGGVQTYLDLTEQLIAAMGVFLAAVRGKPEEKKPEPQPLELE